MPSGRIVCGAGGSGRGVGWGCGAMDEGTDGFNTPGGGPEVKIPGGRGMLFAAEDERASGGSGILEIKGPGNGLRPTDVGVVSTPGGNGGMPAPLLAANPDDV